jgi:hypothetical protein
VEKIYLREELIQTLTGEDIATATATAEDIVYPKTAFTAEGKVTGALVPAGGESFYSFYPQDWVDIRTPAEGNINILASDIGKMKYAFQCTTDGGQYQVDWGDGTVTLYDSATPAEHTYVLGAGEPCSRGYTTFGIVISPDTGVKLTYFEMIMHSDFTVYQQSPVLALVINAPYITGSTGFSTDSDTSPDYLEYIKIINADAYTDSLYFYGLAALKYIEIHGMNLVTSITSMIADCYSLIEVYIYGLNGVTNARGFMYDCYAVKNVTIIGLSSAENIYDAFDWCQSIESIDFTSLISSTNLSYTFGDCSLLRSVLLPDLSGVLYTSSMFYRDINLLGDIDLSSLTSVTNCEDMFDSCFKLQNMIFSSSPDITACWAVFNGCSSLKTIDMNECGIHVADFHSIEKLFYSLYSLESIDMSGMTLISDEAPSVNPYFFYNDMALVSIDMSNMTISGELMDYIFSSLPDTGGTITITGCSGIGDSDPTIATGLGWTVVNT